MISKLLVSFILALFLSGCFQQPSSAPSSSYSIPKWYLNPIPNSNIYLYGVGEGKTLKEAKNNALNDMASRLSVTIDSSIQQYKNITSSNTSVGNYQKKLTQNINVEVKKINFTNASVTNSEILNNSFFVQMKVNRQELFNAHKNAFDLTEQTIQTNVKQSSSLPILERIYALKQLEPTLEKATSQALILNAIENSFVVQPFVKNYQDIQNQAQTLKNNLRVKLSTNLTQKHFANELLSLLNAQGYKIVSTQPNVEIHLNHTVNYSVALGWQITKVSSNISVISSDKTVSNTVINSVGRSSSSKENALVNASKYFKNEVEKQGLDRVLFNQ